VGKHDSTNDDVTVDADADETASPTGASTKAAAAKDTDSAGPTDDGATDDADELDARAEDDDLDEELELTEDGTQSPQTALFWDESEIDPIEIALPSGVGLTLRHYRTVTDDDGDEVDEAVFLAHKGTLHLFRSPEGLIDFINSDAPHDLTSVDTWEEVRKRVRAGDLVPAEEDEYELDLVVENLRGGHDVWEADLLIPAGEVARDIAFACGLDDVLAALAPESPLDELDEGLRAEGFLARRRLKKVGAEQAAIAWRSIIGKITAAVKWHD
jgi:hypothetical protein